ncbi:hypothetical protein EDC31_1733 [Acidomonas methanolica]|nr:hypothetical protein EDC31_1733 [Acidomonas methanolica]
MAEGHIRMPFGVKNTASGSQFFQNSLNSLVHQSYPIALSSLAANYAKIMICWKAQQ